MTGVVVGVLGIRELVVFAFGWTEELGGRDVRAVAVVPLDAVVGMDSRDRERDHCSEEMRCLTGGGSGTLGLDQNNVPQGVGSVGFSWGRENRQCEATIVQELREVGTDLLVGVQGVVGGHAELLGLWGPEEHAVGIGAAADGNAWEGLDLEVCPAHRSPLEGIGLSLEVPNASKGEEGAQVWFLGVVQFKWGDVSRALVPWDFEGEHVHAFEGGPECPEPELAWEVGFLEESPGHPDSRGPVSFH